MRWAATVTIAVLLAGIECLPACAVSSWAPQTPPCHQHHKAPAQASNTCDHQYAVKAAKSGLVLLQGARLPVAPVALELTASARTAPDLHPELENPAPPASYSILRT